MLLSPHSLYERFVQLGEDWADKNAAAELLEETKKSIIAHLGNQSGQSSVAAKDAYALAHDDYRTHIEQMTEARRKANVAKVNFDAHKAFIELLRSKEASERAANRHAT